jgi:NADH-quinone oxidoreductase subunit C
VDAAALSDHLVAGLGDAVADAVGDAVEPEISHGLLTVTVAPGDWRRVAEAARHDPQLACDFFDFLCGVDEEVRGIAIVLHVYSTANRHHLQLRTLVPREPGVGRVPPRDSGPWREADAAGRLPTVSDLWAGANWHERETWEMFGVVFDGHPNLAKLLLPEEFEGFPLRKEFALMAREAKPWPGAKEPE